MGLSVLPSSGRVSLGFCGASRSADALRPVLPASPPLLGTPFPRPPRAPFAPTAFLARSPLPLAPPLPRRATPQRVPARPSFRPLQDDDPECPLCMEEMDLSDVNFKPCPCGYQVRLFLVSRSGLFAARGDFWWVGGAGRAGQALSGAQASGGVTGRPASAQNSPLGRSLTCDCRPSSDLPLLPSPHHRQPQQALPGLPARVH